MVLIPGGSGKLVCTGARKPEDAEAAVDKITEELRAAGLLKCQTAETNDLRNHLVVT